jgi:16S rRNA (cytosine967-C5)-methyltransferase
VVSAYFRGHRQLGPRERHTLAETAYAVLRERRRLEAQAAVGVALLQGDGAPRPATPRGARRGAKAAKAPPVRPRGLAGAASLARRLAMLAWQGSDVFLRGGLGPAELAWLDARRADLPPDAADPALASLRHNLPDWLALRLQDEIGEAFWPLADSLLKPAPLDLRVNAARARREAVAEALAGEGIASRPTPWSPWGLRVEGKPALQKLALFTEGLFEVQDDGSQLLALLTGARRGEMVVDFCAGAGGKTLALGAMMRSTGRLYAFDVAAHRLEALKPRLARSGLSNVHPVAIAHERDDRIKRLAGKIDRVLVDAPCTGLGTLRRNPDLKWRQGEGDVAELAVLQLAILTSAARLPKPGGTLVYATCSLLRAENEALADAFSSAHPDYEPVEAAAVLASQGIERAGELCTGPYLRLWPHRHGCDGFFAAVWRRRG